MYTRIHGRHSSSSSSHHRLVVLMAFIHLHGRPLMVEEFSTLTTVRRRRRHGHSPIGVGQRRMPCWKHHACEQRLMLRTREVRLVVCLVACSWSERDRCVWIRCAASCNGCRGDAGRRSVAQGWRRHCRRAVVGRGRYRLWRVAHGGGRCGGRHCCSGSSCGGVAKSLRCAPSAGGGGRSLTRTTPCFLVSPLPLCAGGRPVSLGRCSLAMGA
mmetsp:Transcript_22693/g.56363  ORF Transcript_22693/g.56363 Transcript_22693/m.56363 type:complete len:213 (+) Transcript_22693:1090-1728(+)